MLAYCPSAFPVSRSWLCVSSAALRLLVTSRSTLSASSSIAQINSLILEVSSSSVALVWLWTGWNWVWDVHWIPQWGIFRHSHSLEGCQPPIPKPMRPLDGRIFPNLSLASIGEVILDFSRSVIAALSKKFNYLTQWH